MPPTSDVCTANVDIARITADLESPDETVRAHAVGALCPCRIGHALFEQYMPVVAGFRHDPSPKVRAAALHVFEDAFEMESGAYPTNPRENSNEMLRRRRASRFAPDEPGDGQGGRDRAARRRRNEK